MMIGRSARARTLAVLGFRGLVVAGAAMLLASCAGSPSPRSKEYFSEAEYGVPASPRLVAHGRPVPKGGGRYMVGKPYRVAGRTYVPRDNPNYSAVGLASWYGSAFHGRKTANGELYDMNELTAAHPTMPLPSYARVTNLRNGRSIVVRVNDRGPFSRKRVIDVSATTAEVLDFKRAGTARVKVEYVGPARMDGLDRNTLLASYRVPGKSAPPTTMVASNTRSKPRAGVILASAAPPKSRSRTFEATGEPMALMPSPAALTYEEDPLAPLILRSGMASSYLPVNRFTKAEEAVSDLAAAGNRAPPVDEGRIVVQLGAFRDSANAERVAERFRAFGQVVLSDASSKSGTVRVVRVVVAGGSPDALIKAAGAAGLNGAFIVSR